MTAGLFAPAAAPARDAWLRAVAAPGVNVTDVEWTTEVKPAAAHKGVALSKRTRAKVLTGVGFDALAENNDRETGDLLWGSWVDGLYPYVIEHTGKDGVRREYARLYTIDGSLETTHYVDGVEVTRETFAEYLTPAARKPKRPVGGCLTIKIENVRVI